MAIDQGYLELINNFPLVEITSDVMHKQALNVLHKYVGKKLATGQSAYLKVLATLIDKYERSKFPTPAMSPREIIKSLMEFNNLRQADLIPYFGSRSQVNDFLVGRRNLSKDQIRRLAKAFSLSADSLLEVPELQIKPKLKMKTAALGLNRRAAKEMQILH